MVAPATLPRLVVVRIQVGRPFDALRLLMAGGRQICTLTDQQGTPIRRKWMRPAFPIDALSGYMIQFRRLLSYAVCAYQGPAG
jgi:hypothetical protein